MKPPIVYGTLREDFPGGIEIYCIYCKRFHLHGVGEGHRGAHCGWDSPYKKSGYIIRLHESEKRKLTKIMECA